MTETAEPEVPERTITFRDREMVVRFPSSEVLVVWQRTLQQLQSAESGSWTGEQAMRAVTRARKIIDSFLTSPTDRDWLDDEMLDGTVTFADASDIILLTIKAFQTSEEEPANRQARRAPRKATRKKATT